MSVEDDDFEYHEGDGSQAWVGLLIFVVSGLLLIGSVLYAVDWVVKRLQP